MEDAKNPTPVALNPAIRNRLVDSALDLNTLKRNGIAQRLAMLITSKTGGQVMQDDLFCRFYIVKNEDGYAAHLEVHYRDGSGQRKQFEKFGSSLNLLGRVENGEIIFTAKFIDDLPLTPDQKRFFEVVMEPFAPVIVKPA